MKWIKAFIAWVRWMPISQKWMPAWEEGDENQLRAFLMTPTGRRFLLRFEALRHSVTQNAVLNQGHQGCQFALGFSAAAAWMRSLSGNVSPQKDEHEGDSTDAVSRLETWASN